MRKVWLSVLAALAVAFTSSSMLAADDTKETDRVEERGKGNDGNPECAGQYPFGRSE